MKTKTLFIIFSCIFLFVFSGANAQNYKIEGKKIISVQVKQEKTPDILSGYTYEDSVGTYDVYVTANGACYVIKVSKKTGKEYRKYLPKELSSQICESLGIVRKDSNATKK